MNCKPNDSFQQLNQQHTQKASWSVLPAKQFTLSSNGTSGEQASQVDAQSPAEEGNTNARMLSEVAQITAQSFQSSQEAMDVALEVIGHFLASQTLFIARFENGEPKDQVSAINNKRGDQQVLKILATRTTGTPAPEVGAEEALTATYCQTILRTQQPLIVEEAQLQPFYQQLATTEKYQIGSYIGVPLIYSDGRIYGTLCSQDPRPRLLSEQPEKLELMQIVARFLISHIEREELTAQVRAAEHAQAELAHKERQARAEADLRVREMEAIFETIGDGLLVSDQHGHLQMNAAARHLLHMGQPQQADLQGLIEQQNKEALIWDESGQPLNGEQWPIVRVLHGEHLIGTGVAIIQRANVFGEKRYLAVSGMPIYTQQKLVNGAVCVFRDITEHYLLTRRTQDTLDVLLAMAESLAWLPDNAPAFFSAASSTQASSLQSVCRHLAQLTATLLQCQDVGIISLEPETAKWQRQTICGFSQISETPWRQEIMRLVSDVSAQGFDTQQLRANEVVTHPLKVQGQANSSLLVEVPMFVGKRLLGLLTLIYCQRDSALTSDEVTLAKAIAKLTGMIYERERLLREQAEARARTLALQETNQRFNEFLSIASHELKGPLTAIKVSIQLAQRALRTQEQEVSSSTLAKLQRYLERMEYQIRVQDRLASDLIDVSRIRVGKLELQKQSCDLAQITREIVEDQRQMTDGRIIMFDLPTEKMMIDGDADRLGQVINNYLTNALKYSSSTKPVGVAVTADSNEVCVTVSDQGPGLTPNEQKRVWERFYRAADVQVLSGHGIGLGLGLHISKTIIELHGGRVGLHSTPGNGSHFWFTLPRH